MTRQNPGHRGGGPSRPAEHPNHLMLSQLRWAGHVARTPDHRLLKRLFYDAKGKRSDEDHKKNRFKDTLRTSLKAFNINPNTREQTAVDQARWRYFIHKGANICEERTTATQQKRQTRKARTSERKQVSNIVCPSCHQTFHACIGLISPSHPPPLLPPSQSQDDFNGSCRLDRQTAHCFVFIRACVSGMLCACILCQHSARFQGLVQDCSWLIGTAGEDSISPGPIGTFWCSFFLSVFWQTGKRPMTASKGPRTTGQSC